MSDEIERIRRDHIADPDGDPNDPHCVMCSDASYPIWPCDTALLLALLAERGADDWCSPPHRRPGARGGGGVMEEPYWLPRTAEEYLQQVAEDSGPQPDETALLQRDIDAAEAEVARLTALLAERDAEIARLVAEHDDLQSQSDRLEDDVLYLLRRASALRSGLDAIHARMARSRINDDSVGPRAFGALSDLLADDDAALAARGGEVKG